MAAGTLMICLGAAKSGTTWLYHFLASHPGCHMRTIKELHFFDALEFDRQTRRADDLLARRDALGDTQPDHARDLGDLAAALRAGDTDAYVAYLRDGAGADRLVADLTPAYSLLPEAALGRMAGLGANVKFVYLLRDPVARLWSHVRMTASRRMDAGAKPGPEARAVFARLMKGGERHIAKRCDYAGALTRLGAALDPNRVFLGFFEDLIGGGGLDRLCAFLGLAPRPVPVGVARNAGMAVDMTPGQRDRAAAYLAPQYDYVARRMGRLPAAWQANWVKG